jgi:phosphatidylserine decarboxylase
VLSNVSVAGKMRLVKHRGKAGAACRRILGRALAAVLAAVVVLGLLAEGFCGHGLTTAAVLAGLGLVFCGFSLWFFRDPDPLAAPPAGVYLAPAHGVVDIVDEATECEYMGGPCRRVSIFLSVFDVHVQNAPVAGRVVYRRHHPGEFLNAMNLDSAARNENVMFGFADDSAAGERVGVRLMAGLIARRIVPWAEEGDLVSQGERIGLIQYGSRVNLYLPLTAQVRVRVGDRVRGGVTVVASRGGSV